MPATRAVPLRLDAALPYLLIAAAIIGLLSSFALTYDKIQLLQDPSYRPSCNINPILSCVSVMKTEQASFLGVPNTIFGLIAFSMLLAFGALLAGGAQVNRLIWLGAQVAATIGVFFMHHLFFQGVFVINAICPWCFLVWMITIPTFLHITLRNLRHGVIRLPARLSGLSIFVQKHHVDILVLWYCVILGLILQHFWYFWTSLI
ncbi:vitamin K epoxide reductase family protein [Candidatus Saccharibacteria bacterium]|nr:vitamin K epoxide reductase family protein [Candidatus Saccharibacteria bacterium]